MMKEKFHDLIRKADQALRHISIESDEFSFCAQEILSQSSFLPTLEELSHSYLWQSPYQHYKFNNFSEMPLTLHHWENFHLDLYIWKRGRTGIHDHHFQGAFKVLTGSYLQYLFRYEPLSDFYAGISKGRLSSLKQENISIGEARPIIMGNDFIHSVSHTEEFNMTLCLRTKDLRPNLHEYLLPGFKISRTSLSDIKLKHLSMVLKEVLKKKTIPLDPSITPLDVMNFSERIIRSSDQFDMWWNYISSEMKDPKLEQLKVAFKKTKIL